MNRESESYGVRPTSKLGPLFGVTQKDIDRAVERIQAAREAPIRETDIPMGAAVVLIHPGGSRLVGKKIWAIGDMMSVSGLGSMSISKMLGQGWQIEDLRDQI